MRSIFNKNHAEEFIHRINNLNNRTQPQWGKMNVAQMLHHCQYTFKLATGDLIPSVNPIIRFLFGKNGKKQLVNDPEFKKNLPTFSEVKIVDPKVFEVEREKLVKLISEFQKNGPSALTKAPHPFFGEM